MHCFRTINRETSILCAVLCVLLHIMSSSLFIRRSFKNELNRINEAATIYTGNNSGAHQYEIQQLDNDYHHFVRIMIDKYLSKVDSCQALFGKIIITIMIISRIFYNTPKCEPKQYQTKKNTRHHITIP